MSTPEERRKQLEEEEPKRGRGQKAAPAMCWGLGVVGEPCQPRDLEGEPHLLGPICMLPAPPPRTPIDWWSLGWSQPKQLCPLACPSNHWAQDPREGGASEKDSRPLL